MKRTIRVAFADQHRGFDPLNNDYLPLLKKHYDVIVTKDRPEYLIYSVFGTDHLNYDCVRIFYTGECITPDFNECDYAAGFDRLEFGDRYIRFPYYLFHGYEKEYLSLKDRPVFTREELKAKKGFCSFVVSNCFGQDDRTRLFETLSTYQPVASGGRYRNNVGGAVKDKIAFGRNYRFCIACENACYPGYVTEKIVDAFASRAVPIYYGDPTAAEDFNPKAFVSCHDYDSFEDVLEEVRAIDQDEERYLAMINEPPVLEYADPDLFEKFLIHIIDQPYEKAFRRPHSMYTKAHDEMILRHAFYEKHIHTSVHRAANQIRRIANGTMLSKKRSR